MYLSFIHYSVNLRIFSKKQLKKINEEDKIRLSPVIIIPIWQEDIGQLLSYIFGGCIINHHALERRKRGIAMERPVISDFQFGFCGELKQLSYWGKHCVVKLWKSVFAKFHHKTTILFKCIANIFASRERWTWRACTRLQVQVGEIKNWNLSLCLDSHGS